MQSGQRSPDIVAWLSLGIYGAAFPALVLAFANLFNKDLEPDWKAVQQYLSFSILLAIAFSLLVSTISDLLFEGMYPGHWPVIVGVFFASVLIVAIGIGARHSATIEGDKSEEWLILVPWLLLQIAITLVTVLYCAILKSWQLQTRQARMEAASDINQETTPS